MFRGILPLALSLCLGAAAAPAALAQGTAPGIPRKRRMPSRWTPTFISIPSCRWTCPASNSPTSSPARNLQRPDEHVRQRARISAGRLQGCRALQLRHAVFRRVARHDQGARRHLGSGYRRTLLPAADARHVDRRFCLAGLANDGHQGRDISGHAAGLEAGSARKVRRGVQAAEGYAADRRANALCLGHRPHQDRRSAGLRCGPQDPGRLQGHAAFGIWQDAEAGRGQDRPERRHEDAAEGPGRYHDGGRVFRLCRRVAQAASAACHRSSRSSRR